MTTELLGTDLWSRRGLQLALRAQRAFTGRGALAEASRVLQSARSWLASWASSREVRGLLAPWVLHGGVGPDDAGSGFVTELVLVGLGATGMPVPRSGGAALSGALSRLIEAHGGELHTAASVEQVVVARGAAIGERLDGGPAIKARRAVLCSVAPGQLYGKLLASAAVPPDARRRAGAYRFGLADLQIHLALAEPPRWVGHDAGRLARTAVLHLTSGLDGVATAVAQARSGLLPAQPTIVCGQPMAVDPTRGPPSASMLWIQLQEVPRRPVGDALGGLAVEDGTWTRSLAERYADRIVEQLARHAPNLDTAVLGRAVLSPADLETANVNLIGGDPYAGDCAVDQSFVWRPLPGWGHRTPNDRLYHIGASTDPGPGLHGTSDYLAATALLACRSRTRRRWSSR